MDSRFNAYERSTYDFLEVIMVVCPRCEHQAIVRSPGIYDKDKAEQETKLTCTHCGYNNYFKDRPLSKTQFANGKVMTYRSYLMNTALDPFFRFPLWLVHEMKDGLIWAYNYEHLNYLEQHVRATLRERSLENMSNRSIGSRLPRWMTSKKNRDSVLKAMEKLKHK